MRLGDHIAAEILQRNTDLLLDMFDEIVRFGENGIHLLLQLRSYTGLHRQMTEAFIDADKGILSYRAIGEAEDILLVEGMKLVKGEIMRMIDDELRLLIVAVLMKDRRSDEIMARLKTGEIVHPRCPDNGLEIEIQSPLIQKFPDAISDLRYRIAMSTYMLRCSALVKERLLFLDGDSHSKLRFSASEKRCAGSSQTGEDLDVAKRVLIHSCRHRSVQAEIIMLAFTRQVVAGEARHRLEARRPDIDL